MLENVLPRDLYKYRISFFKVAQESNISKESKFESIFEVNLCSEEGVKSFLKDLENSTSTGYTIDFGDKRNFFFKLLFLTIENVITI